MDQAGFSSIDVTRLIAGSLALGAVIFWIVALVMTGGGREGLTPGAVSTQVAVTIVAGVLAAGMAGALFFRGRALGFMEDASRTSRPLTPEEHGSVTTNLIISWSLIEAPALVSGVLFLLLGETLILWVAVPLWAAGVAMTFPRAEWFGAWSD